MIERGSHATGEYLAITKVADLREGFLTVHDVEGRAIVVARTDDRVTVWDGTCPHAEFQFGPMRLQRGCELECPMHGARFHVDDGRVLKGPATEPLVPIDFRIDEGVLLVLVDWL